MAITVYARGSGTLSASAPGVQATVDTICTDCVAGYTVTISPRSALPEDGNGMHTIYGYADTGYVRVKSSRNELPSDVEFDYVVYSGTA